MDLSGIHMAGPQITKNGTFLSNEELLDGRQPAALNALVINKSLEKSAEMADKLQPIENIDQLRTELLHASGKGLRLDSSV